MALFLIDRKEADYDQTMSMVVRAWDRAEARQVAAREERAVHGDRSPAIADFLDPERSTVTVIPEDGPAAVIHTAFLAG